MARPIRKAVVHTIGLVNAPANRRSFVMKKSADDQPDEVAYETFRRIMNELGDKFNPGLLGLAIMSEKTETPETPAQPATLELPEDIKTQLVEFQKSQKLIVELQKSLEEQKTLREVETSVARCEKDFKNIPLAAQELGTILVTLRKSAGAEVAGKVEELLVGVEALLAKTMAPIGSSQTEPAGATAWERIEKSAKALQGEGKAKSYSEAVSLALTQNPELYKAYVAESKGQ